jgi:YfiH family protein
MQFEHFPSLQHIPNLRHAITTRAGGVSRHEYASLNLGMHVGDELMDVRENRRLLGEAFGFDYLDMVCAQQVHGAQVQVVTPEDRGRGARNWETAVAETDALIVEDSQTPALILVADCAPVLLVDEQHQILAVVHAGWRGAVESIASKTLRRINQRAGSKSQSTLAGIGPCLCVECLEIGEEVAGQIPDPFIVRQPQWAKPHLDLRALIAYDLESAGVQSHHIEIIDECPRCRNEKYFSHRGQNGTAGRFGLVAWWE